MKLSMPLLFLTFLTIQDAQAETLTTHCTFRDIASVQTFKVSVTEVVPGIEKIRLEEQTGNKKTIEAFPTKTSDRGTLNYFFPANVYSNARVDYRFIIDPSGTKSLYLYNYFYRDDMPYRYLYRCD